MGYDVYGDDISKSGKQITEKWLEDEGLSVTLGFSDMTKIPYPDNFFDVIINRGVITHNTIDNIKKCISEMYRTLKINGLVMTTFISTRSSEYGKGQLVARNTYIPTSGPEEGVIHHFVDKDELDELMQDFQTIKVYEYKHSGLLKIGDYISSH